MLRFPAGSSWHRIDNFYFFYSQASVHFHWMECFATTISRMVKRIRKCHQSFHWQEGEYIGHCWRFNCECTIPIRNWGLSVYEYSLFKHIRSRPSEFHDAIDTSWPDPTAGAALQFKRRSMDSKQRSPGDSTNLFIYFNLWRSTRPHAHPSPPTAMAALREAYRQRAVPHI